MNTTSISPDPDSSPDDRGICVSRPSKKSQAAAAKALGRLQAFCALLERGEHFFDVFHDFRERRYVQSKTHTALAVLYYAWAHQFPAALAESHRVLHKFCAVIGHRVADEELLPLEAISDGVNDWLVQNVSKFSSDEQIVALWRNQTPRGSHANFGELIKNKLRDVVRLRCTGKATMLETLADRNQTDDAFNRTKWKATCLQLEDERRFEEEERADRRQRINEVHLARAVKAQCDRDEFHTWNLRVSQLFRDRTWTDLAAQEGRGASTLRREWSTTQPKLEERLTVAVNAPSETKKSPPYYLFPLLRDRMPAAPLPAAPPPVEIPPTPGVEEGLPPIEEE